MRIFTKRSEFALEVKKQENKAENLGEMEGEKLVRFTKGKENYHQAHILMLNSYFSDFQSFIKAYLKL